MTGPKRKRIYEELVRRDGECCYIGGEKGTFETLVIDHLDNNPKNNNRKNLHLVCRSINHAKNPRGRSRKQSFVCVSGDMNEDPRPSSAEMAKNLQSEPDFRHWLFMEIWRKGGLELDDVIYSGAAAARCSPETVRRYTKTQTRRLRPFDVIEDLDSKTKHVVFRLKWEKAREKEENRRILNAQAKNWKESQGKRGGLRKILSDCQISEANVDTFLRGPCTRVIRPQKRGRG